MSEENQTKVSTLLPDTDRLLKLTWAFSWRLVIAGAIITLLEAIVVDVFQLPVEAHALKYINLLAVGGAIFGIFSYLLNGKKIIGDFRLALIKADEDPKP